MIIGISFVLKYVLNIICIKINRGVSFFLSYCTFLIYLTYAFNKIWHGYHPIFYCKAYEGIQMYTKLWININRGVFQVVLCRYFKSILKKRCIWYVIVRKEYTNVRVHYNVQSYAILVKSISLNMGFSREFSEYFEVASLT